MNEFGSRHDCLIAFGSNMGDSQQIFEQTRKMLENRFGDGLKGSRTVKTMPIGGPSGQPDYLNGTFGFSTSLSPFEVHQHLLEIEAVMGRERHQRWGARTLDLDLLLFGNEIIATEKLTIPHPRMAVRKFVLGPAVEIAPDLRHPVCNRTLAEILSHLKAAQPSAVWVTENEPFSEHCRDLVLESIVREHADFRFQIASEPDLFETLKQAARFVVWSNPRAARMAGKTFDGPQFDVNLIDYSMPIDKKNTYRQNTDISQLEMREESESGDRRRPATEIVAEITAAIQSSS